MNSSVSSEREREREGLKEMVAVSLSDTADKGVKWFACLLAQQALTSQIFHCLKFFFFFLSGFFFCRCGCHSDGGDVREDGVCRGMFGESAGGIGKVL